MRRLRAAIVGALYFLIATFTIVGNPFAEESVQIPIFGILSTMPWSLVAVVFKYSSLRRGFSHWKAIDMMDPRSEIVQDMGDRLLLRLRSVGGHEWEVQVNHRPASKFPENLLYEGGHGAHPTQIYAWNVASRYFPDERRLCVPGYPYEVVIRIKNAETRKHGEDVFFDRGKIEVEWSLHGRNLQEGGKAHVREGRLASASFASFQFEPGGQRPAGDRLTGGRDRQRVRFDGPRPGGGRAQPNRGKGQAQACDLAPRINRAGRGITGGGVGSFVGRYRSHD